MANTRGVDGRRGFEETILVSRYHKKCTTSAMAKTNCVLPYME